MSRHLLSNIEAAVFLEPVLGLPELQLNEDHKVFDCEGFFIGHFQVMKHHVGDITKFEMLFMPSKSKYSL